MDKNAMWNKMIGIIKQDVTPATGCTEPIALAYAAATAARELGEAVRFVDARVSANLMKNGMGARGRRGSILPLPSAPSAGTPERDYRS
jgi:L-cysteine desulfidase